MIKLVPLLISFWLFYRFLSLTAIDKRNIIHFAHVFMSLFVLARGTLNFLFRLKLSSQLFWGGRSLYSLWSELQVMESKSLVVIDCLRWESVSKLAWFNASLYGTNGKIIRIARFCSCSNSTDKYAGSALWNTGHAYSNTRRRSNLL